VDLPNEATRMALDAFAWASLHEQGIALGAAAVEDYLAAILVTAAVVRSTDP
jgi:hypothetical protein